MPRRRKTQSGADAQDIQSVSGQRYGEGKAQQQMQRAMPAPQQRDAGVPAPSAAQPAQRPQPQTAGPAPAARPPQDPSQFLQQLPKGLLRNGDAQMPVTSGLASGPGAGPEVLGGLGQQTPLERTLREMYRRTGDPSFARLLGGR